jgi:HK97 gp10 family phage protein
MAGEVYLNIQNVANELLPEKLKYGLETIGQKIENVAKENCPVDDGQLRASITHQITDDLSSVEIGSNLEYAPYVHNGTGLFAKDGDGRKEVPWRYQDAKGQWHSTKGQKPNPFLQKAVDDDRDNLIKVFENLLERQKKGE